MTRPFSAEWLGALEVRLRTISVGERGDGQLLLGQIVTGTPSGTVSYTIVLGGGLPSELRVGESDDADVILLENYETGVELLAGTPVATTPRRGPHQAAR